eukprot:265440-Amphidinium_carterae.3
MQDLLAVSVDSIGGAIARSTFVAHVHVMNIFRHLQQHLEVRVRETMGMEKTLNTQAHFSGAMMIPSTSKLRRDTYSQDCEHSWRQLQRWRSGPPRKLNGAAKLLCAQHLLFDVGIKVDTPQPDTESLRRGSIF